MSKSIRNHSDKAVVKKDTVNRRKQRRTGRGRSWVSVA